MAKFLLNEAVARNGIIQRDFFNNAIGYGTLEIGADEDAACRDNDNLPKYSGRLVLHDLEDTEDMLFTVKRTRPSFIMSHEGTSQNLIEYVIKEHVLSAA